jgi:hypothetical protein
MASINQRTRGSFTQKTYEGAPAVRITAEKELRRAVASCLLWEDQFYESGEDIATRISKLAEQVPPATLAALAIEAREVFKLRHVPLVLLTKLAKTGSGSSLVSETIARVIQRADELAELLAMYWKLNPGRNGKNAPLSAQMKLGLSQAFAKFDAYGLSKYDRENAIKLRDVAFLAHAKPSAKLSGSVLAKLVNKSFFPEATKSAEFKVRETYGLDGAPGLEAADTWEVALSGGADKRETFERLIRDGKLGYLALLRNLRNMADAGVDRKLVMDAIEARKGAERVLPFRFTAAARAAPSFEPSLDIALIASIDTAEQFDGETIILVDVSGSMDAKLSGKSDLTRADAAATLGAIFPGRCRVITFSESHVEVPARKGMAGVDAILRSQRHSGTYLGRAVEFANAKPHDRLIVITDEQSADRVPTPKAKNAYMINVAGYRNAVGYGDWVRIDGFSENTLRFIREYEAARASGDIAA